jgi:hypothetical protein
MPSYAPKFVNVVFIGNFNPQILTPQFLIEKGVIPASESPFKEIVLNKERPFTEFTSTPIIVLLQYGNIVMVVEQNRYQISDNSESATFANSPISKITKNYFSILEHTPIMLGGLNINGQIIFNNNEELAKFEDQFIRNRQEFQKRLKISTLELEPTLRFSYEDGVIKLQFTKLKENPLAYNVAFNYEFPNNDLGKFLSRLDAPNVVHAKFNELMEELLKNG